MEEVKGSSPLWSTTQPHKTPVIVPLGTIAGVLVNVYRVFHGCHYYVYKNMDIIGSGKVQRYLDKIQYGS